MGTSSVGRKYPLWTSSVVSCLPCCVGVCPILRRDGDRLGWGCEEDASRGFREGPGGSSRVPGGLERGGSGMAAQGSCRGGCVQLQGLLQKPAETKRGYSLFSSAVRVVPNVVTVPAVIRLFLLASRARNSKLCSFKSTVIFSCTESMQRLF